MSKITSSVFPSDIRFTKPGILGIDSVHTIPAGVVNIIVSIPQKQFRIERLFLPRIVAECFDINDIRIGYYSETLSPEKIPAELFSNDMGKEFSLIDNLKKSGVIEVSKLESDLIFKFGERISGNIVQVGQSVFISVTNNSGSGLRFRGAYIGLTEF